MEWLGILFVVGVAFYLGRRSRPVQAARQPTTIGLNSASDRELMLATFRRELANYMVQHDPDRYLALYRKARVAETRIDKADVEERQALQTIITKRYPMYEDFDLIATRPYVLYADALSMYPLEDLEEHYLNLVQFHALQRVLDPDWQFRSAATSDEEFDHLCGYVKKIKDTKFQQRLTSAVEEFFANRKNDLFSPPHSGPAYETNSLAVYYVPHLVENRYGFHFKDTGEFGLYSVFHGRGEERYESLYRSDRAFEKTEILHYLRIEERL